MVCVYLVLFSSVLECLFVMVFLVTCEPLNICKGNSFKCYIVVGNQSVIFRFGRS